MCQQQEVKVWGPTGYPEASSRYAAYYGDIDYDTVIGYGLTPEAAIEDLNWKMEP